MPKDASIKKTLVIGSGAIVIGQAAEFDYAGTQACRALREEGVEIVLVNSNPATIMTDKAMAQRVYLEPMNLETIKEIIRKERPDSLLPTLGGQTGLNLALELDECGFLDEMGISIIGTGAQSIFEAEDREGFRSLCERVGEPTIESVIVHDVQGAVDFASRIGYPVIVRPAYTLGGTGGGMAADEAELREVCADGLAKSRAHQCLIERSVAGWKEVEFEIIRDGADNCICVCDMENIDPVGIHTGDSIVVAPCKTLSRESYQMLKDAAFRLIRALNILGSCNVQYALHENGRDYYLIEVNPRLSRSSALASKATSYPIARVATKIALGLTLDEIKLGKNAAHAHFEPRVEYTVLKIPRWPFDKFTQASRTLGTKMKATGEVMAIGANFASAMLKAVRSLELGYYSLCPPVYGRYTDEELWALVRAQDDRRLFAMCELIKRDTDIQEIYEVTKVQPWFLREFQGMIEREEEIRQHGQSGLTKDVLWDAKAHGVADFTLCKLTGIQPHALLQLREELGVVPSYRVVDTCPHAPGGLGEYYYSVYGEGSDVPARPDTVVVLGSGPIRIGQGIEFDYCSVHCTWALRRAGKFTVIINNNPETVSTDFDTADRLYFEPLTPEDVYHVLRRENPLGVVTQFGGQTAIKLAGQVMAQGFTLLGTSFDSIDRAESRERFDELLTSLDIKRPKGSTVFTKQEALAAAKELGYPVLVRPSYVLGGQGMTIAQDEDTVIEFMDIIGEEQEHPVLIDKYHMGREVEVDAVCDGADILIPGIMEHVERAGVHSGDSISVYPAGLRAAIKEELVELTRKLALALDVRGLVNIQYIVDEQDCIYIIEVNPRSSRTVPYISKVTDIQLVDLATRAMLGERVAAMGHGTGLYPDAPAVAVKVPVFSLDKLAGVETSLGPEMKSTGEVLGLARDLPAALYKGLLAANLSIPDKGTVFISVADGDKQDVVDTAVDLAMLGYDIVATQGTAAVLNRNFAGASVATVENGSNTAFDLMQSGKTVLVINTPTHGRERRRFGFQLRRMATERGIPCLTSPDTARALVRMLKQRKAQPHTELLALQDI